MQTRRLHQQDLRTGAKRIPGDGRGTGRRRALLAGAIQLHWMLVFPLFVLTVETSETAKRHGLHYATNSNRAESHAFLVDLSRKSLRAGLELGRRESRHRKGTGEGL